MKKTVFMTLFMSLVMLLMPLSVLDSQPKALETAKKESKVEKTESKEKNEDIFRLYDPDTKKITEINAEDYIFGVVAAEMPALYETEALKAQAVAAYTYASFNRKQNVNSEYDVSTDPAVSQCYITEEEAIVKWGEKAEEYKKKIKSAVQEVSGYGITFDGEIILAVYHAISGGVTEDSVNVWGKDYPYLKAVDSNWDKTAENYATTVTVSAEDLRTKIGNAIKFEGEEKDYMGKISCTNSGTVKEMEICNQTISGYDVRKCLDLRSANFNVVYGEEGFVFTVYGYGHGVGMSQFGANCLAKEGKNFKEILEYYYTDCEIKKIN